jgi:hypothetical protein
VDIPQRTWTVPASRAFAIHQAIERIPPARSPIPEDPGPPPGFSLKRLLSVGDREAGADRQGGELIDRVAAGAPVRELVLLQALGHARVPFARIRADHGARIEPAAVDAHGAAEAAADLEGGFDDGVVGEARGDRLEIGDFPGRTAADHSVVSSSIKGRCARCRSYMGCRQPRTGGRLLQRPLKRSTVDRAGKVPPGTAVQSRSLVNCFRNFHELNKKSLQLGCA